MPQQVPTQGQNEITPDEVYAELQAILRSPAFQRSEKLQAFLKFICETTLQGSGGEINEYLIGSKVFRRGDRYNPSEDSIVRRHAHAMRQKLQEYYAAEGATHPIRIEMPVGRYVPMFRRREDVVQVQELPAAAPPQTVAQPAVWPRRVGLLGSALAIFGLGWLTAYLSLGANPKTAAEVRDIWGPWLGSQAVICFSNPTSALIRHFPEPVTADVAAHTVRVQPDQEKLFREKFPFPNGGGLHLFPTIAQTMMGEASASTHLATLFARTGVPLRTMESRFLSWEAMRRDNYVILGGDVENHWVDVILEKYPLRLNVPSDGSPRAILNTAPRTGEQAAFHVIGSAETREEYALISMLPGIAESRQLLLICGLNSPASPSATEFLTTEKGLRQLRERLREAAPTHMGPWHFQVVIKADVRDKVPTTSSIAALRVLP
jgi:hypothetical protein